MKECLFCPITIEQDFEGIFICKECLRKGLIDLAIHGDKEAKKILSKNKF